MPTKAQFKKGKLEVRAINRTRIGLSDNYVDPGTLGYVITHRSSDQTYLIYWPHLRLQDSVGSHPQSDLEPTGNRG
jgi:hypothetical protein